MTLIYVKTIMSCNHLAGGAAWCLWAPCWGALLQPHPQSSNRCYCLPQGEMVDRIEANIKQSSDYVVKAKENVQQAVTYQKKARKV